MALPSAHGPSLNISYEKAPWERIVLLPLFFFFFLFGIIFFLCFAVPKMAAKKIRDNFQEEGSEGGVAHCRSGVEGVDSF